MAVTVSLALLFGLVLFGLIRNRDVGPIAATIAVLFGFFLASTGAAGPINEFAGAVVGAVQELDF
ncbi:hypothetical protein G6045_26625 [Streptomyces sp. YC504]|uniref:Uncharacterized protein n=1 Tax=Streptomyces mesophilus TaxID=1775132 RepID=A0A6G4XQX4_9ACTN|nr:hypothetical protein [Streptomyces mesophilus]NGO79200.1 hypothetical protein [Streptomyces mesophilus]